MNRAHVKCSRIYLCSILFVFAVLCNGLALADESPEKYDHWKKLLYFSGGQSLVTSDDFFLSERGSTDFRAELDATVDLLNSGQGTLVACNFPARYLWIKDNGYNVPPALLDHCPELSEYVSSFQKDSLNLVFVSEHIDSPQSAFGHILLVFHDESKPLLSADTIHFAAETEREGLIRYAYKGLSGGYMGYFIRTPFYIIKNNYAALEQRYLYFYKLNLGPEQIEFLVYHMYELRKAEFKYYFMKENCAYYIAALLDVAYDKADSDYIRSAFVLPKDVASSYKDEVVSSRTIEASLMRAQRLYEGMASDERKSYALADRGELQISNSLPSRVKEMLTIKREYMFRRHRWISSDYNDVIRLRYYNPLPDPVVQDPASTGKSSNMFGMGFYNNRYANGALLRYRMVGSDIYENQLSKFHESELLFMDAELALRDGEGVQIQRLDIIGIRSMFSRNMLSTSSSWAANLSVNRQNSLNVAVYDLSAGVGRGHSGKRTGLSYLLEAGVQNSDSEGDGYLKPSVDLIAYPADSLKAGIGGLIKYGRLGRYKESTFFVNKDIGKFSVLAKYVYTNSISGNTASLILMSHF